MQKKSAAKKEQNVTAKNLARYQSKRNFNKTAEPTGKPAPKRKGQKGLLYCVQHHLASRDHYDFRLEWGGVLLSWAVPKGPSLNPADRRLAIRVEDHPLAYGSFEGTIPQGEYGGGTVQLWDSGVWQPVTDPAQGLRQGMLKLLLQGERLRGHYALVRLKSDAKGTSPKENWLLLKEKDAFAKNSAGISRFTKSVSTGRTMAQIAANAKPEKIPVAASKKKTAKKAAATVKNPFSYKTAEVQLCKMAELPADADWLYEVKYDGYRVLAFLEAGKAGLYTRNHNPCTARFAPVAKALEGFFGTRALILDGEVCVVNQQGKTDFGALQTYIRHPEGKKLVYMVFDLLALDGQDLRKTPLRERKRVLENLLLNPPKELYYAAHVEGKGKGKQAFAAACRAGLEGVVAKRGASLYKGARNGDWVKCKRDNRQEFVVGGYTRTEKKRQGVSALLLGVYNKGVLQYAGRAGTGFTAALSNQLGKAFAPLARKTSPFAAPPAIGKNERVTWLRPSQVAEVKFTEWTKEGRLRQASFKGLRTDKPAALVVREENRQ